MGNSGRRRGRGGARLHGAANGTDKSAAGARKQTTRSRDTAAAQGRSRPNPPPKQGRPGGQAAVSSSAENMEQRLRVMGADVEMVEREVFDGTHRLVATIRHRQSVVRNVNQEAAERMSLLDKMAVFITDRVGTFGFFLIIFFWTVIWLSLNTFGPLRWDPAPAFVLWLFISNMIQIFLMPLLMVGQNLQGRHSEIRAQADFDVNKKAEIEVEAILLHLEQQAAQIERQGEVMLDILRHLQTLAPARASNDGEPVPAPTLTASRAAVPVTSSAHP